MRVVCVLVTLLAAAHAFHPDGVHHEANLRCHVCNASYYCLGGQQFDCPANSLAGVDFADKIAECVCNPGYLREGDLCNLGQPPAWYMYGVNETCVSTRETIAAGASGHQDCVCVPGFAGLPVPEAVRCQECPADTYADVHNTSTCVPCPEHASHAQTKRTNVSACLCDPGYSGPDGGPCVACAAGTFKAEPGAALCESCGANEYSETNASACVACHANSSSLPASPGVEHCLCDPGFYPSDGLCTMCHAGRFKNTTANEPCRSCTGNTFASELGATACSSCLVFSPFSTANPSEGGVRCQCIAGYTQTELNLTTPACSACPPDTFQPSQGQTTCELCDPNARSPEASVTPLACLCNAGFFDDFEHQCQSCAGGTYKEAAADDEEDTELCNACSNDSFSLPQSGRQTDCLCEPGFSGPDGGPCAACAAGTFKAANGSAACEACPLHTYSDADASTSCQSCTQFLDFGGITLAPGQNSSDACECDVSQGFSTVYVNGARKCTGCTAGTYASAEGCRNCSNGTFNDEGAQTTCKQCPVNASSYDYPHVSCQCHKGYRCDVEYTKANIPVNYLHPISLDMQHFPLQVGFRSPHEPSGQQGGLRFGENSGLFLLFAQAFFTAQSWQQNELLLFLLNNYNIALSALTLNTIDALPQKLAQVLPICDAAMSAIPCQKFVMFASNLGAREISDSVHGTKYRTFVFRWLFEFEFECNLNAYGQGTCTAITPKREWHYFHCSNDYHQTQTLQCWLLVGGNYNNIGRTNGDLTYFYGMRRFFDLKYHPLHVCLDNKCTGCDVDTFKLATGGAAACSPCQAFSQSLPASTSQDMCLCKRGYRQDGPNVCVACAGGTYTDVLDSLQCSQCPADTYTPSNVFPWDAPNDCQACAVCNKSTSSAFTDHYDAARGGQGCGLDQPSSCQACPAGASLFLPTTASQRNKGVSSCVCDANFYGLIGTACTACPAGQVRPDFLNANTTLADCLCAAGFEPDPAAANLCRQCPLGTYKPYTGDHNCTACPATLTTAQTGNANASACACAPGRGYVGDKCVTCLENHYKAGHNLHTCLPCRDHAFAPPGSTAARDCLCGPGFSIEVPESSKKQACMQYTAPSAASVTAKFWPTYYDYLQWSYTNVPPDSFFMSTLRAIPREYYDWNNVTCGNIPWDFFGDAVVMTRDPICEDFGSQYADKTFGHSPVSTGHYLGNICYMAQRFYGSHVGCFNQAPYWPICTFDLAALEPTRPTNMPCQSAQWTYGNPPANPGCYYHPVCVPTGGITLYFEVLIGTEDWRQTMRSTWVSIDHSSDPDFYYRSCLWSKGLRFEGKNVMPSQSLCPSLLQTGSHISQRLWTYTKYSTMSSSWCTGYGNGCRQGYNDPGLYGGTPFTIDDQGVCKSAPSAYPRRDWDATLPATWLWARDYKNDPQAFCQVCPAGRYKNTTANLLCTKCPSNSATNNSGSLLCEACATGKTTDGRTGQVECVCDIGTEPGADGVLTEVCQTCRAGTYKAASTDKYANRACVNCSSCAANKQVATECSSTLDVTCRPCQANSWSYAGRTRLDPCFCNAGYELQGELCVACPVGKARQANHNNSIRCELCGPGFANTSGQSTCHPCSEICEGVSTFVKHECNASRDVVCQQCQTCAAGFYANNTCGVSYANDRLDTQCAECPADYYCPGGILQAAVPCPDNGKSARGSDAIADCTCDPGFYRAGDSCVICPLDAYCPRGVLEPVACPAPGRTLDEGSAVRLDCHCPRSYFRDPPADEEGFNCTLCTPDDYCFNNSLYNCSDALMQSEPGSGFFENCTCVNRFYNNGTRCEDCRVDHYCVGGRQHACASREWTNGLGRQEACVCQPGFVRESGTCVPCSDDFFCDGSDDRQHPCPPSSLGRRATNVSECLCNVTFEVVHSNNVSEPHSCQACADHYFKHTVGNTPCLRCSRCLPQTDSVWTRIVCDSAYDALCDSCAVCHHAAAVGSPEEQWAGVPCQEFADTVCLNCSTCNYTEQWEKAPCAETSDRVCASITRSRTCEVGEYAGNHSRTSDSLCLQCSIHDTLYEGQRLHYYTSAGRRYDDATSCDLACRPFSRLRDPANPALGCVSCEVGNVLFKVFTQNDTECTFSCLQGYDRRGDDCVLAPRQASPSSFWNHSLNVTHVQRVAVDGSAAFRFTVSHTSHGRFAVVVGQTEPSCAGRVLTLRGSARTACCFGGLWRVSTQNQLGLSSSADESCSLPHAPPSRRLSDSQLQFDVPDTNLTKFALCAANSSELACVLQVSIVDVVLLHHFSVAVPLELRRGAALAFLPGAHTYVPLLSFHAEVQLAYFDGASPVFLVITDTVPLPTAGTTAVLLLSSLQLVEPGPQIDCSRYAGHNSSSISAWSLDRAPVRASTFLRAQAGTSVVKVNYALRLREREGQDTEPKNSMTVAVWRNLSLAHAVCAPAPLPLATTSGEVLSCSGLGAFAVASATALHDASDSVRGELGGLTSFVARAALQHVRRVHAVSLLAAFAMPPAAHLLTGNVTAMRGGRPEFTDAFRAACGASPECSFRYIFDQGVHHMSACDLPAQNAARAWLRTFVGVVEDAGHVQALCALAQPPARQYAFVITLVNTRAYLPRAALWHDLQNRSAPESTSKVFALFEFL